jgi:predicted esterase
MSQQDIHTIQPTKQHTHTIIFLHGRDSTAEEFASEIFESQGSDEKTLLEALPNYRWVFPSSGKCTSSRFDTEMSQWFDIWSLEIPEVRNETQAAGLKRSTARILALIELEASLVPHQHIFLAGISQGCATAV